MTTGEILFRLDNGGKITLSELQRLERRLSKLRRQVQVLEKSLKDCYDWDKPVRTVNPQRVET
jgi:hypothetical protein